MLRDDAKGLSVTNRQVAPSLANATRNAAGPLVFASYAASSSIVTSRGCPMTARPTPGSIRNG